MDEANDNRAVKASYSAVRSGIIRLTPESIQCKLYCRGANCKYCSCKPWKADEQAIPGVYSSWITDKIVAMARPTTDTFINYDFVEQLKKMKIRTIINMQTAGEHAFCGPPLLPSGFTYDPEILMRNKIYFYNFDWPDFGALGLELLLNVVKVMHFAINEGNVAVHCHAGLGRTGVIVASYLVWNYHLSAAEAINYVRKKRPHSVQSSKQIELINAFECFLLNDARVIPRRGMLTLRDYLQLQEKVLCNSEARRYNHIPKIVHLIRVVLLENIFVQPNATEMRPQKSTEVFQRCKSHCDMGLGDCTKYTGLQRRISSAEMAKQMCSLLKQENDAEMDCEIDASLASGIFSMVNMKSFVEERIRGRVHFALYVLHRFMQSLKKPIASQRNMIRSFCIGGDTPLEAWQCLFYTLLNLMSLICRENSNTAAQLLSLWYTGENKHELSAQIDSYLQRLVECSN